MLQSLFTMKYSAKRKFNSESDLITYISALLPKNPKQVITGIGDDAAVIEPSVKQIVMTTDTLVEGSHFLSSWLNPFVLGRRAAVSNLSDISAMGGLPLYALVSLILPAEFWGKSFIKELYQGLTNEFSVSQTKIVGGNIAKGKELSVTLTLIGSIVGKPLTRNGAKMGDLVCCTGFLGSAASELYLLLNKKQKYMQYVSQQRVVFAKHLVSERLATAGIDISDGLALDLHRLCTASNTGALIFEKELPVTADVCKLAKQYNQRLDGWLLYGGEDYELLFTVKKENLKSLQDLARSQKTLVSVIGEITSRKKGVKIKNRESRVEDLLPRGWDHLKTR